MIGSRYDNYMPCFSMRPQPYLYSPTQSHLPHTQHNTTQCADFNGFFLKQNRKGSCSFFCSLYNGKLGEYGALPKTTPYISVLNNTCSTTNISLNISLIVNVAPCECSTILVTGLRDHPVSLAMSEVQTPPSIITMEFSTCA